jgi:hypothetical protein
MFACRFDRAAARPLLLVSAPIVGPAGQKVAPALSVLCPGEEGKEDEPSRAKRRKNALVVPRPGWIASASAVPVAASPGGPPVRLRAEGEIENSDDAPSFVLERECFCAWADLGATGDVSRVWLVRVSLRDCSVSPDAEAPPLETCELLVEPGASFPVSVPMPTLRGGTWILLENSVLLFVPPPLDGADTFVWDLSQRNVVGDREDALGSPLRVPLGISRVLHVLPLCIVYEHTSGSIGCWSPENDDGLVDAPLPMADTVVTPFRATERILAACPMNPVSSESVAEEVRVSVFDPHDSDSLPQAWVFVSLPGSEAQELCWSLCRTGYPRAKLAQHTIDEWDDSVSPVLSSHVGRDGHTRVCVLSLGRHGVFSVQVPRSEGDPVPSSRIQQVLPRESLDDGSNSTGILDVPGSNGLYRIVTSQAHARCGRIFPRSEVETAGQTSLVRQVVQDRVSQLTQLHRAAKTDNAASMQWALDTFNGSLGVLSATLVHSVAARKPLTSMIECCHSPSSGAVHLRGTLTNCSEKPLHVWAIHASHPRFQVFSDCHFVGRQRRTAVETHAPLQPDDRVEFVLRVDLGKVSRAPIDPVRVQICAQCSGDLAGVQSSLGLGECVVGGTEEPRCSCATIADHERFMGDCGCRHIRSVALASSSAAASSLRELCLGFLVSELKLSASRCEESAEETTLYFVGQDAEVRCVLSAESARLYFSSGQRGALADEFVRGLLSLARREKLVAGVPVPEAEWMEATQIANRELLSAVANELQDRTSEAANATDRRCIELTRLVGEV